MEEIVLTITSGVVEVDGIPDHITVKVIDDGNVCYLPEDRSDEDYAIAVVWSIEDVRRRAKERGISVTTEQAVYILDQMEKRHDAEVGISWSTIDFWLDELTEAIKKGAI